jgi:hypothetical protein
VSATNFDVVWASAPFASPGQFRHVVGQVADRWVSQGLLTAAQRGSIVAAAARAHLGR